jgi:probable HAF family extracellular repeat protein
MRTTLFRILLAGVLAASASYTQAADLLSTTAPSVRVRYTLTDLGPIGGAPGQPLAIADNGLVAGSAAVSDTTWHTFLWYQGLKIDIGKTALGGPSSTAFGLNNRGQAVGEAETSVMDPNHEDFCGFNTQHVCQPFLWEYGAMIPLPTLKSSSGAPATNALANAINKHGEIVGSSENGVRDLTCPPFNIPAGQHQLIQFKPVAWVNGKIQELPTVGGDPDGLAFGVNDNGQIVGSTGSCTEYQANGDLTYLFGQHAVLWQNGTAIDLGSLGGLAPGGGNVAIHVNNWGQVVGESGDAHGGSRAFVWTAETGMLDLGAVGADVGSVALSNNDRGDIVGISFDTDGNPRAFLRPDGGVPVDLNSLLPADSPLYLIDACSINLSGQIIGIGIDLQGNAHGFLVTPSSDATTAAVSSDSTTLFAVARKMFREQFNHGSIHGRLMLPR